MAKSKEEAVVQMTKDAKQPKAQNPHPPRGCLQGCQTAINDVAPQKVEAVKEPSRMKIRLKKKLSLSKSKTYSIIKQSCRFPNLS
jgi:hypothetical protein